MNLSRLDPELTPVSPALREFHRRLREAALTPYPVLIVGESGTGKEHAARQVHDLSPRSCKPFIAVNCGALPDSLLTAELFGHDAGAFTGAHRSRSGLFEAAHTGTLFLDEVETMSPALQDALLRVLQDGHVRKLGSNEVQRVDVRLVAATNIDLGELVERNRFRSDLKYRLEVLRLDLPPLRERREEIPRIAQQILERIAAELQRPCAILGTDVLSRLCAYPWPGNVRELESILRRTVAHCTSPLIEARDLELPSVIKPPPTDEPPPLMAVEDYLRQVVERHGPRIPFDELARRLGISRKTLWEHRRRWNLQAQVASARA